MNYICLLIGSINHTEIIFCKKELNQTESKENLHCSMVRPITFPSVQFHVGFGAVSIYFSSLNLHSD